MSAFSRGVVLDRHAEDIDRQYTLYIPESPLPTTELPVVVSLHGTDGSRHVQMGPDTEALAFGGHDFGGPTWPQVAEQYGFIVICPDLNFGTVDANALTDYSECAMRADRVAVMAIIDELQRADVIGTELYITGFSSGANLALRIAFRTAPLFSAVVMRHSQITTCFECQALTELDYLLNVVPVTVFEYDSAGICQAGSQESATYDWKSDPLLKDIAMHVISGTGEGTETWPEYSYADNTEFVFNAMVQNHGFRRNLLTQQVFTTPSDQNPFFNCSDAAAPDYPHFCHAQDRDLVGERLFNRVGP